MYAAEFAEIDSAEKMSICLKCGKKIMATDKDVDVDICQECSATYRLIGSEEPGTFLQFWMMKMAHWTIMC